MSSGTVQTRAARGVIWMGGGQLVKHGVTMVTSVVLARLLSPDDFGLFGMTFAFAGLAQVITDFGFGWTVVQRQESDPGTLTTCFWINLGIATGCAIILGACSPLIAAYYGRPEIVWLVCIAAINVVVAGFAVIPGAILVRDLRFDVGVRATIAGSLTGSICAIILAWLGAGVWSLIVQTLLGSLVACVLMYASSRWRPTGRPSLASVKGMVEFSFNLLGSNLLGHARTYSETLIVGRVLGGVQLGMYSMAQLVPYYSISQVSVVFVRVLFPTLSKLLGDPAQLRSGYLKAVSAIAMVTFPMLIGLFSVADDFVDVILGQKWLPAAPVLRVLCWITLVQSVATTSGTLLLATGASRTVFRLTLANLVLSALGIYAGTHWGIVGVAIGSALVGIPSHMFTVHLALTRASIPYRGFITAVGPAFVSSLVMLGVVALALRAMAALDGPIRLAIAVVVGAVVYTIMTLIINRERALDLFELARAALRRA